MISAPDASSSFFTVDDKITLHIKTWGTESATPVLFVHVSEEF